MYFQETYIWVESGMVGKILYRLFLFFPYLIIFISLIKDLLKIKLNFLMAFHQLLF
jgi:hypothetical protein